MSVAFAKATHIFSAKNMCELDIVLTRIVNILTTNELVKLMMLWTTGPRNVNSTTWTLLIFSSFLINNWFFFVCSFNSFVPNFRIYLLTALYFFLTNYRLERSLYVKLERSQYVKLKNWMSNSVDLIMSRLTWIYAVCKSLLLLPMAMKGLTNRSLGTFSAIFTRETTSVIFFLLSCEPSPFWKRSPHERICFLLYE